MKNENDKEIAALKERLSALERSPNAPPRRNRRGCLPTVVIGFLILVIIGAIGSALNLNRGPGKTADTTTTPVAPTDGTSVPTKTGNLLNDALLQKSPAGQAAILGKVVGEGCRGKRAFYDGIGHSGLANGQAFWSVRCVGGKSYIVKVSRDEKENKVLECSVMHAIHAGECFNRF